MFQPKFGGKLTKKKIIEEQKRANHIFDDDQECAEIRHTFHGFINIFEVCKTGSLRNDGLRDVHIQVHRPCMLSQKSVYSDSPTKTRKYQESRVI